MVDSNSSADSEQVSLQLGTSDRLLDVVLSEAQEPSIAPILTAPSMSDSPRVPPLSEAFETQVKNNLNRVHSTTDSESDPARTANMCHSEPATPPTQLAAVPQNIMRTLEADPGESSETATMAGACAGA